MGDAERDARVRAVRERHERWMRERDSEMLRRDAEAELQAERRSAGRAAGGPAAAAEGGPGPRPGAADEARPPGGARPAHSGGGDRRGGATERLNPVEVMDRITERLTSKLKVEIREELRRDESARMMTELRQKAQMDGFLAKELETHTCPICYEMMASPEHTPQLLFPCGHTFCKRCLTAHLDTGRRSTCPFCRSRISDRATNVSLQQIIQTYLRKRAEVMDPAAAAAAAAAAQMATAAAPSPADRHHPAAAAGDGGAPSYESRLRELAVRIRILENESEDNARELEGVRERRDGVDKVLGHLARERERLAAQMSSLQAELELVDAHATEQQQKMDGVRRDAQELAMRQELVRETIDSLRREHEKLALLSTGAAHRAGGGIR